MSGFTNHDGVINRHEVEAAAQRPAVEEIVTCITFLSIARQQSDAPTWATALAAAKSRAAEVCARKTNGSLSDLLGSLLT